MHQGGGSEVERMAALETDIKYVVKTVEKIDDRFDKLEEHLSSNYATKTELGAVKDRLKNLESAPARYVSTAIAVAGVLIALLSYLHK